VLALDFSALDLDQHTISVERGWDLTAREFIETKSRRPRTVPIGNRLAMLLADHRVLMDHPTDGLLCPGRDPRYPIHPRVLRRHAAAAWQRAGPVSAGLPRGPTHLRDGSPSPRV
jgi:integrase